jgi:preprotein translocase subunit SecE
MENENKKIITLSFVVAAGLAGLLISTLIDVLATSSGTFSRIFSNTYAVHGVPVVVAVAVFAYLFLNTKISIWAEEVVVEIRKVVWPSRKDTTAMTILVCVMVVISGVFLGVIDLLQTRIVQWIIDL